MKKKNIKLFNKLSNEDLAELFTLASERSTVFVGSLNNFCVVAKITHAYLNGAEIQINLDSAEVDSIENHHSFKEALKNKNVKD